MSRFSGDPRRINLAGSRWTGLRVVASSDWWVSCFSEGRCRWRKWAALTTSRLWPETQENGRSVRQYQHPRLDSALLQMSCAIQKLRASFILIPSCFPHAQIGYPSYILCSRFRTSEKFSRLTSCFKNIAWMERTGTENVFLSPRFKIK